MREAAGGLEVPTEETRGHAEPESPAGDAL